LQVATFSLPVYLCQSKKRIFFWQRKRKAKGAPCYAAESFLLLSTSAEKDLAAIFMYFLLLCCIPWALCDSSSTALGFCVYLPSGGTFA
jgi:hypothetical protein